MTFLIVSMALFTFAAIIGSSPMVAGEVIPPSYVLRPWLSEWEALVLGPWQHWDGLWYLKIAAQGYEYADFSVAFFPLYPLLIRAIGWLFSTNLLVAAMLISVTFYLVALIYLYRLATMEIGESAAKRSVIYLAVFPTSFFFLAVYTESLFLALTLAVFFYARKGNWAMAGAFGLLASLTRSTGLLLFLPLLIEYLQQRKLRLSYVGLDALFIMLLPIGTGLYAGYNQLAFGDALAFVRVQENWQRSFSLPWDTLANAWNSITEPNILLVTPPDGSLLYEALLLSNTISGHAYNLAFFMLAVALTMLAFVKLRPAYGLYSLFVITIPLFSPSATMPLLSVPRFVVVLFPLMLVLALLGTNRIVHWAITTAFAIGLVFFLIRFASWYWVA